MAESIELTDFPNKIAKTTTFALGRYSQTMDLLQTKMHALAIIQIDKNEDPEDQATYNVDIDRLANIMGVNKRSLRTNLSTAAQKLNDSQPTIRMWKGSKEILTTIFQSIIVDHNLDTIDVRYTYDFRKTIIEMKSKYDIIYPIETILSFTCKYTMGLYNFLLAKISKQRLRTAVKTDGKYRIETSVDEILETIQFEAKTNIISKFNQQAILPACKDLNLHSELYIENGAPISVKKGKKTVGYIFNVTVRTNVANPMFSSIESIEAAPSDIPTMEYILLQLEDMGVNKQFRLFVEKQHDSEKAWKNLLYCRVEDHPDDPKYFNTAYTQNYAKDRDMKKMFQVMHQLYPRFDDDVTYSIHKYYERMDKEEDDELAAMTMHSNPSIVESPKDLKKKFRSLRERLAKSSV